MFAYFLSRMREKKIQRAAVTSNSSVFPQRRKTPKAEALQQKAASALATWAGSVGSLRYHWGKLSFLAAWEGHPGLGHLASYHVQQWLEVTVWEKKEVAEEPPWCAGVLMLAGTQVLCQADIGKETYATSELTTSTPCHQHPSSAAATFPRTHAPISLSEV